MIDSVEWQIIATDAEKQQQQPSPIRKGNEEYLYMYSAILAVTPLTKRSDMDQTVLPANYTMPAFPS